jgi:hypothetical protein
MNYVNQALKKLAEEYKGFKGDRYQAVMKSAVRDALEDFCKQNEEFAQAVVQGGSFADCMEEVSRGIKNALSDLEAYRRAVSFYFEGAKVKMTLTIQMEREEAVEGNEPGNIEIDLMAFLLEE